MRRPELYVLTDQLARRGADRDNWLRDGPQVALAIPGGTIARLFRMSLPGTTPSSHSNGFCPVLIVEDDADLREMMAQLLTIEGFRAHSVANGREALDYLHRAAKPDVILLDLMMPVMDGWEFRKRQKRDPEIADLPVVVLSAVDPARVQAIGAEAFLTKPLDFDRLLEIVHEYCQ